MLTPICHLNCLILVLEMLEKKNKYSQITTAPFKIADTVIFANTRKELIRMLKNMHSIKSVGLELIFNKAKYMTNQNKNEEVIIEDGDIEKFDDSFG